MDMEEANSLPDKVFETPGEILVLYGQHGIIQVAGQQPQFCFFSQSDAVGFSCDQQLVVGRKVLANARLAPLHVRHARVAYMCRTVWPAENPVPAHLFYRMIEALPREDISEYIVSLPAMEQLLPSKKVKKELRDYTTDFLSLGSVLAMQGIIQDAPLQKKPVAPSAQTPAAASANKPLDGDEDRLSSSSSSTSEDEKRKKKKKKHKKEKKKKKDKKSHKEKKSEKERGKKSRAKKDEEVPPHLVLHRINDVIAQLEKQVKGGQADDEQETPRETIITYPEPGIDYDPSSTSAWSQHRGFLNPAQTSSWFGLVSVPGALEVKPLILQQKEAEILEKKAAQVESQQAKPDETKPKKSVFEDIFGEERPRTPEYPDDGVPQHALYRRPENEAAGSASVAMFQPDLAAPSAASAAASTSNSLAKALQFRLQKQSAERRRSTTSEQLERRRSRSRENKSRESDRTSRPRSRSRHRTRSRSMRRKGSRSRSRERRRNDKKPANREGVVCIKERSRSRDRERSKRRSRSMSPVNRKSHKRSGSGSADKDSSASKKSKKKSKSPNSEKKKKKKKKKKGKSKENLSDVEEIEEENKAERSDGDKEEEEDDAVIEKIRRKRAKILARLPTAEETGAREREEVKVDKGKDKEHVMPIVYFEQQGTADGEVEAAAEPEVLKVGVKYRMVVLTGSSLTDGSFQQLFQLSAIQLGSAAEEGEESGEFFAVCTPELVCSASEDLSSGSKSEVMESLHLKSSKFDVSQEGRMNVYYRHPVRGQIKTVCEKTCLLNFISYLKALGEPALLLLHYKDSLLPLLLAKLTHYKLLDHFSDLVLGSCDLVGLAWSRRMDSLWTGKHYPSLGAFARHVSVDQPLQSQDHCPADVANKVLGSVFEKLRGGESLGKVLAEANKTSLIEYMSVRYSMIQAVRCEDHDPPRPAFLELTHSHEAWGNKIRVDLIWRQQVAATAGATRSQSTSSRPRATPPPLPPRLEEGDEELVTIIKTRELANKLKQKARKLMEADEMVWANKTYNAFLSPGEQVVEGRSTCRLRLRIPALKLTLKDFKDKAVLVEPTEDFSLCEVVREASVLKQAPASLFPVVEVLFRNPSCHPVQLNSEHIAYPVATIRLEETAQNSK